MTDSQAACGNPVMAGTSARLALRQRNLAVLLPVLLHDVNGALNGVTLATELLARLSIASPAEVAAGGASAATLLQRTRTELGRLKQSLKSMEHRLLPVVAGQSAPPVRRAALAATLREVQDVLMPAVRRGQHELRVSLPDDGAPGAVDHQVPLRADELFDLVAGLLIVAIEGAAPRSTLEVTVEARGDVARLSVEHGGAARADVGLEMHRELLRQAAAHAGGDVVWHQSGSGVRARLRLPRREP